MCSQLEYIFYKRGGEDVKLFCLLPPFLIWEMAWREMWLGPYFLIPPGAEICPALMMSVRRQVSANVTDIRGP